SGAFPDVLSARPPGQCPSPPLLLCTAPPTLPQDAIDLAEPRRGFTFIMFYQTPPLSRAGVLSSARSVFFFFIFFVLFALDGGV
ncbi:hypothetical protein IscW_ISCW003696, partial [Ixodes scapularis]